MRCVLVTGGVGFIGSHVCEELVRQGYSVCIIDSINNYYDVQYKRKNLECIYDTLEQDKNNCRDRIYIYETDIRDSKKIDDIFSNHEIEIVIHLASCAGVRPSIENATLYSDVNINGTLNILECMKKYSVKKLLFASSSSVYGNNAKIPFSENDTVNCPISPYAATKKAGELLCYTYHHLYNINTACLRFFTVYGPRQRPDLAIYKFTNLIFNKKPISIYGDGLMQRDYTYVTDTIDGVLKAMQWVDYDDDKRFEIFNLGESHTITLIEMVKTLEKAIGIKVKLNYLPEQPGDVKITHADIQKAIQVLGYNPRINFEEGINKFVEWFRVNRV